jgi:hypothetical protein
MNSRFAIITFTDGQGGSIDNTLPGAPASTRSRAVNPGLTTPSLDSPAIPSHGLPPGAVTLPVFPFDPTVTGQPIVPGKKFIVKYLACTGLILVPDNSLPPTPEPK